MSAHAVTRFEDSPVSVTRGSTAAPAVTVPQNVAIDDNTLKAHETPVFSRADHSHMLEPHDRLFRWCLLHD